jgi:N-acetylmuramoyl-L-alanine amidase
MVERTIRSPNWSPRPRGLLDVYGAILHHTASSGDSAVAIAKMFANPSFEVAAHDVVGDNGLVIHCVSYKHAAWQAGLCRRYDFDRDGVLEAWESAVNTHTIGIELCNRGDGKDSYPDVQVRTCAALIRRYDRLCPNFRLRNVTDHEAVNLRGKIDVQPNFPAARLFWYILHPRKHVPAGGAYKHLPEWAQRQVDEIKR